MLLPTRPVLPAAVVVLPPSDTDARPLVPPPRLLLAAPETPMPEAAREPPAGDDALALFELLFPPVERDAEAPEDMEPPPDAARDPPAGEEEDAPLDWPPALPLLLPEEEVEPPPEAAREPPAGEEELGPLLLPPLPEPMPEEELPLLDD